MIVHPILASLLAPEIIVAIAVIGAILFGAERIPKLARSLGKASTEFDKGRLEDSAGQENKT
jgi:sec-independent protein translocase protein TatA